MKTTKINQRLLEDHHDEKNDRRSWRAFGGESWNWNKVGIGAGAAAAMAGAAYAASRMMGRRDEGKDFHLRLQTDETMRLISSKKVEGTAVFGRDGERLGSIDNFMVDKYTGRVGYAVMSFGGHFGFGASLFPLPWAVLDFDEKVDGYRLALSKEEFKEAPRFEANNEPEFDLPYRRRILIFYRQPTLNRGEFGEEEGSRRETGRSEQGKRETSPTGERHRKPEMAGAE